MLAVLTDIASPQVDGIRPDLDQYLSAAVVKVKGMGVVRPLEQRVYWRRLSELP